MLTAHQLKGVCSTRVQLLDFIRTHQGEVVYLFVSNTEWMHLHLQMFNIDILT